MESVSSHISYESVDEEWIVQNESDEGDDGRDKAVEDDLYRTGMLGIDCISSFG